jgi:hypothetical protein
LSDAELERLRSAVTRLLAAQQEALDACNWALDYEVLDEYARQEGRERLEAALEDVRDIVEGASEDVREVLAEADVPLEGEGDT